LRTKKPTARIDIKNFEALTTRPGSDGLQPLKHPGAGELVEIVAAAARPGFASQDDVDFCRRKLALPAEQLNPPSLLTGDDLIALGIPPGKQFAILLRAAREAQLDGHVFSADEAIAFVRERWQQNSAGDARPRGPTALTREQPRRRPLDTPAVGPTIWLYFDAA
jgi:hypothetical protein